MAPSSRASPSRPRGRAQRDAGRSPPVDTAQVEARLRRARVRLALTHPFLAAAVMRLPLRAAVAQYWCPTAATDGHHIFFNPDWVARIDDAALRGLLAHEVLHVLFAHSPRLGGRDPRRWNRACDFAINALLIDQGFRLPRGGLHCSAFDGLPAEAIYPLLIDDSNNDSGAQVDRSGSIREAGSGEETSTLPVVGDDLVRADDPRVRPLQSDDAPDAEQAEAIRAQLRADARARLSGESAQRFDSACQALETQKIDWRAVLQHRLSERIQGDWSLYPFSKRHIHRGLYMPSATLRVPDHIVFAIDTSGSMSDQTIARIVAELRAFRETFPCRLTIIQADSILQSVKEFQAMDGCDVPSRMTIMGRGGTDFRPVFDWMSTQAPHALLVYATDGWGAFPERSPGHAVLWLLTGAHAHPVPFGSVLRVIEPTD